MQARKAGQAGSGLRHKSSNYLGLADERLFRVRPPDRIDVKLDRPVVERDVLEYRIAAVQSHEAVTKPSCWRNSAFSFVCQWSAVMLIVIGFAPWAIGSADRKHTQSAILFRVCLVTSVFMTPAYEPGSPSAS